MFQYFMTPFGFWYGFVFLILFSVGIQSSVKCFFLLWLSGTKQKPCYYLLYAFFGYALFVLGVVLPPMSEYLGTLIGVLFGFIFIRFIIKQNLSVSAFLSLFVMAVNILVESILTPLLSIMVRIFSISEFVMTNISVIAFILISIGVFSLYANFFKLDESYNNKSMWLLSSPLLFICLVFRPFIVLSYTKLLRYGQAVTDVSFSDDIWFLIISVVAMLTVVAILFSYKKVTQQFKLEKEALVLSTQISVQKSYVEEVKQRYDTTNRFRHDFKNHISVLSGLIKEKDFDRAENYLSRFADCYEDMTLQVVTGNITFDILLSEKLRLANQYDIKVKTDIDISSRVKLDDFDLCTIFANALDNAIKACKSLDEENKLIDIIAKPNKDFYIIDIINIFDEDHFEKGNGIGITTIKMIAEKYGGYADVSSVNNEFRLSIILPVA